MSFIVNWYLITWCSKNIIQRGMALFRQGSTQYDKHTCITSQKTTNSKSWRKLITRFAPRSGQRLRKICYGKVEVLILFLLEFQQYMTYDQTFYLALMHYYSWTGKFYTCTCILFFCQKSYAGEPEFIFIECNAWWEVKDFNTIIIIIKDFDDYPSWCR